MFVKTEAWATTGLGKKSLPTSLSIHRGYALNAESLLLQPGEAILAGRSRFTGSGVSERAVSAYNRYRVTGNWVPGEEVVRMSTALKVLCVLYPDPVNGYPPVYARSAIPTLTHYPTDRRCPRPSPSTLRRVSFWDQCRAGWGWRSF